MAGIFAHIDADDLTTWDVKCPQTSGCNCGGEPVEARWDGGPQVEIDYCATMRAAGWLSMVVSLADSDEFERVGAERVRYQHAEGLVVLG